MKASTPETVNRVFILSSLLLQAVDYIDRFCLITQPVYECFGFTAKRFEAQHFG
jgi:hypothetical protein